MAHTPRLSKFYNDDRIRKPDDYDRANPKHAPENQWIDVRIVNSHHDDRYSLVWTASTACATTYVYAKRPDPYPDRPTWTIPTRGRAYHVGAIRLRIQTDDEHSDRWYGADVRTTGEEKDARTLRAIADTIDAVADRILRDPPAQLDSENPIDLTIAFAAMLQIDQFTIDGSGPYNARTFRIQARTAITEAMRHWPAREATGTTE